MLTNLSLILFFQKGKQASDTKWRQAILEFSKDVTNIIIEGVVGPGYQGDIAIDDVTLTAKDCGKG